MKSRLRPIWVFLHRWVGLAITVPLIVVGLTGSLLAFLPELNHAFAPQLHPPPRALPNLPIGELAARGTALLPQGVLNSVYVGDLGTASLWFAAPDGSDIDLEHNELYLDPYSGAELGRTKNDGLPSSLDGLMSFIYELHYSLALGSFGYWTLGIVALLWTIDCFISFYLTLPARLQREPVTPRAEPARGRGYLRRWAPAWQVKRGASAFRLNFDLHRAGGLWVWMALLVYAWSSVYMNLHDPVYAPVTRFVLDYPATIWESPPRATPVGQPRIDWREAEEIGKRHMNALGGRQGFAIEYPIALSIDRERGIYIYVVRSSRDIKDRKGHTTVAFDADTGVLMSTRIPTGEHSGTTVTSWLNALHDANVAILGLPYRIFVSVLGLVIVMLSVTGLVVWLKKRQARRASRRIRARGATPFNLEAINPPGDLP